MTDTNIRDERVDALVNAAILTDTQIRMAFAPENPKSRIIAVKQDIRQAQVDMLRIKCSRGSVHLQIKSGFGRERHIELTIPELLLVQALADKFVMELPSASGSAAIGDDAD